MYSSCGSAFPDLSFEPGPVHQTGDRYFDSAAVPRQLCLDVIVQPSEIGPFRFDLRTGNNSTSFSVSDIVAISDDDDFMVLGGVGDSVISVGQGWTHAADVRIGTDLFEHYAKDGIDVFVDSDIRQLFS